MNKSFMNIAVKEANKGMDNGEGGPFGAIIVKNGEVISKAHNQVIKYNDPTCHAEIQAIRKASKKLKRFDLSDCEIWTSCEPCPMCFAAIQWAKIKTIYYGCNRKDAKEIGFDDDKIYEVIKGVNSIDAPKMIQIDRDICIKPFEKWTSKNDKVQY